LARGNPLERHFRDIQCAPVHAPQEDISLLAIGTKALNESKALNDTKAPTGTQAPSAAKASGEAQVPNDTKALIP
jgi:hypothetical protein